MWSWLWPRGMSKRHRAPAATHSGSRHHSSVTTCLAAEQREPSVLNKVYSEATPGRAGDCDEPIWSPCSPKTCCRPPLPTYFSSSSLSSGLRPSRPASRLLQHFSYLIIISPLCFESSSRASYLWVLSAAPCPGRPFLHPIHPVHSYLPFKTRLQ